MSQFLLTLTVALFFSYSSAFTQNTGTEPTEEVPVFESHMLEHLFKGCPGGSKCTKETGLLRQGWHDILKTKSQRNKKLSKYKTQYGMPIVLWSYPLKVIPKGISTWRSPCPQHNSKDVEFLLAEVISKDLKSLLQQENFVVNKVLLRNASGKFTLYPMPINKSPVYMSQNKMIYNLDMDGEYYAVDVSANGDLDITDLKKPERFPENIKCTDDMLQAFKQLKYPDGLFESVSCKSVWDINKKVFNSIVYGWSCS